MSGNSKIQWTEKTWNPIAAFLTRDITVKIGPRDRVIPKGTRGWFCIKCSPGCANCYAEGINFRLGNGLEYLHRNLADIEFRLVNLEDPLKWRKPCVVFVNSMTDLFLEHIPVDLIAPVFAVMALAGHHTFQILTKRAERMRKVVPMLSPDICMDFLSRVTPGVRLPPPDQQRAIAVAMREQGRDPDSESWPLQNVWLGVSTEDQQRADERIPFLLETPAAVRFLSCEPLLGPIELSKSSYFRDANTEPSGGWFGSKLSSLDWVIVGGESGRKARPCHIEWIDSIRRDCARAGVACFVKQLGTVPVTANANVFEWPDHVEFYADAGISGAASARIKLSDRKGGDIEEWPDELRVRQFPKPEARK